ncbi:S1 RNA-binding domain-containing protein [bacterium]|nr:S1 RNA-binding domain-containing protein [bacterium]
MSNEEISLNVGDTVEGLVTHITNFGAFVKLINNQEGLVHISEIANEYVTDINNHVTIGAKVEVKIVGVNKQGKLELSIKQLQEAPEQNQQALFIRSKSRDDEFETKLTSYLKKSDEKQVDLRRNLKKKQGITKKKR